MRLLDLSPRWLDHAGEHWAIMFLCPHCAAKESMWLTCFFRPISELLVVPADYPVESVAGSCGARLLFYEAFKALGHHAPEIACWHDVVSCRRTIAWNRTGEDFATMSITPSIDASAAGHWHGFVTNGEIK